MYKSLRSAACLAVLACSAALASAATVTSTTYDFGFFGFDSSKGAVTTGSFTTNASDDITAISGYFGDTMGLFGPITGLAPLSLGTSTGFNFDNKYNGSFDDAGVLFLVGGQQVNLYGEPDGAHVYTYANGFGDITGHLFVHEVSQTFAPEVQLPAVPEPTSMALMLSGLMGMAFLIKRRKGAGVETSS